MKQKIHKNSNGGFTIVTLIIAVAIMAIIGLLGYPYFAKTMEISRESTDLSSIRSAYSMVMSAYLLNGGIDPTSYRKSGPNDAENNEKVLGTSEVIKTQRLMDNSYDYTMYVWVTQKEPDWQSNSHSVSGVEVPAPNTNDQLYKVSVDSGSGALTVTTTDFRGSRQCMN